jgi:hypothetical protein
VKLPNTGRGGTNTEADRDRWVAAAMAGAAAVSAFLWRGSADSSGRAPSEEH